MKLIGKDNPKLKTRCEYTGIKQAVSTANKLITFTRSNRCLGLSANQLGIMHRVCIAKIGNVFKVFVNPDIISKHGQQISEQEGCLSFPGIRGDVKRPQEIEVTWESIKDWEITKHKQTFTGFDAIVLEHEIDHLNGIRCIDKMFNKAYR